MRVSHLLVVLFAAGLAGLTVWQAKLHRRAGDADLVMQEVREICPANLVRFPESGNLLLEAGMAWDEQPAEWRQATLERLRVAHGADRIWRTSDVPYRDADGRLMQPDFAAR